MRKKRIDDTYRDSVYKTKVEIKRLRNERTNE